MRVRYQASARVCGYLKPGRSTPIIESLLNISKSILCPGQRIPPNCDIGLERQRSCRLLYRPGGRTDKLPHVASRRLLRTTAWNPDTSCQPPDNSHPAGFTVILALRHPSSVQKQGAAFCFCPALLQSQHLRRKLCLTWHQSGYQPNRGMCIHTVYKRRLRL